VSAKSALLLSIAVLTKPLPVVGSSCTSKPASLKYPLSIPVNNGACLPKKA
jgi:hypothetical protein